MNNRKAKLLDSVAPYKVSIGFIIILALIATSGTLAIPAFLSHIIDVYTTQNYIPYTTVMYCIATMCSAALAVYVQNRIQIKTAEAVAHSLREKSITHIARQSYSTVYDIHPATIVTTLTTDVDAVKLFVSQALPSVITSILIIIGTSTMLFIMQWKLAVLVLLVIPLIAITFGIIFKKIKSLFLTSRSILDQLGNSITETIAGAALIRILTAAEYEKEKFETINTKAKKVGLSIVALFASLIPAITFFSGIATIVVVVIGGQFVIAGTMTIGSFTAFLTYVTLLIFPILLIGFMSTTIAQASASYVRIQNLLETPIEPIQGTTLSSEQISVQLDAVSVVRDGRYLLKDISFTIPAGKRIAIVGPTAAGKTVLLSVIAGLLPPSKGCVYINTAPLDTYNQHELRKKIGFVFQESSMFTMSIRENIAFTSDCSKESFETAVHTAMLDDFISNLPEGFETQVSERGTSLSGGQKQRIMLARALTIHPKLLLLDDITARVDIHTEQNIMKALQTYYPKTTIVSVAQTIASVRSYDTIIFLMEGECIASGTHETLITTCPEYAQLYHSQQVVSSSEQ